MDRFSEEINAIPGHTPTRRVMTAFFHVARENAAIFNLLHQAGMDSQIQESLDQFILSCPHFPSLDRRRTYPAYLFSGALFRLLIRWYSGGMTENDSELSNIFVNIWTACFEFQALSGSIPKNVQSIILRPCGRSNTLFSHLLPVPRRFPPPDELCQGKVLTQGFIFSYNKIPDPHAFSNHMVRITLTLQIFHLIELIKLTCDQ